MNISSYINSVTISILTFNRAHLLVDLLSSLRNIKFHSLEIIVVDNHSEDGTEEMVTCQFPEVKYIRTDKNIGVVARNLGLAQAKGDIIITLDDDVIGLDDCKIEHLISIFNKEPSVGAVNFKVIFPPTNTICNWVHHRKVEEYHDKRFLTYEITEGAVAFRKAALDKSGLYPESFFISHEGPDLAFRIFEADYDVIYDGNIQVDHLFADEGRPSWRKYYYDTRNLFWLAVRNFPFLYACKYLFRGLSAMSIYSLRDGFFKYWLKAVFDGVRGLDNAFKERKKLSKKTMKIIKEIDSARPSLIYQIRKRLFQRSVRI